MPESDIPSETDPSADSAPADAATENSPETVDGDKTPAAAETDAEPPAPPMNRAARRGNARGGRQPLPRHVGPMSGRGLAAPGKQNYANRKSG